MKASFEASESLTPHYNGVKQGILFYSHPEA